MNKFVPGLLGPAIVIALLVTLAVLVTVRESRERRELEAAARAPKTVCIEQGEVTCYRTVCTAPSVIQPPMSWPRLAPIQSCNGWTQVQTTCQRCLRWLHPDGGITGPTGLDD